MVCAYKYDYPQQRARDITPTYRSGLVFIMAESSIQSTTRSQSMVILHTNSLLTNWLLLWQKVTRPASEAVARH